MRIKGIPEAALKNIVENVSKTIYGGNVALNISGKKGNFINFRLGVKSTKGDVKGYRIGMTGRKISAACWHVHRDVMKAIFKQYPGAILVTAFIRYDGQDDFLNKFEKTGQTNAGSMMQPIAYQDLCNCHLGTTA